MFDRTKQSEMAAFIKDKDGIVEEDEDAEEPHEQSISPQTRPQLNDIDEARLQSCLDEIRNVIGDSIPERILVSTIVRNGFDMHRSLDAVLNTSQKGSLLLRIKHFKLITHFLLQEHHLQRQWKQETKVNVHFTHIQ
jgi:elongation factor 1 alpha-like protein